MKNSWLTSPMFAILIFIAFVVLQTVLRNSLATGAIFAFVFLGFMLMYNYNKSTKKLATGTKALITKDTFVVADPQSLQLVNTIEFHTLQKKTIREDEELLLNQKVAVGEIVSLPEGTPISVLGYWDKFTCKFEVLGGNHTGGIYYCPSRVIEESKDRE
jgi:hypothetical protein